MARFIVFHKGSEDISQDAVVEAAQAVQRSLPEGIKWLNSWFVPGEYRLICEWEAPDEQSVRAALAGVMDLFPVEVVHEVVYIQPEWYK
jgi:muconolactone delta-isomerase